MKCKFLVQDEFDSSYDGKKGHVDQRSVLLADASSDGRKLMQLCEFPLDNENKTLSGKLTGKVIEIEILELALFGGRLRIRRGTLLGQNGK